MTKINHNNIFILNKKVFLIFNILLKKFSKKKNV